MKNLLVLISLIFLVACGSRPDNKVNTSLTVLTPWPGKMCAAVDSSFTRQNPNIKLSFVQMTEPNIYRHLMQPQNTYTVALGLSSHWARSLAKASRLQKMSYDLTRIAQPLLSDLADIPVLPLGADLAVIASTKADSTLNYNTVDYKNTICPDPAVSYSAAAYLNNLFYTQGQLNGQKAIQALLKSTKPGLADSTALSMVAAGKKSYALTGMLALKQLQPNLKANLPLPTPYTTLALVITPQANLNTQALTFANWAGKPSTTKLWASLLPVGNRTSTYGYCPGSNGVQLNSLLNCPAIEADHRLHQLKKQWQ